MINIIKIPANDIAEKLGSGKVANIVVLGAILGITKIVTSEGVLSSLEKINPKIKGEILEINKKAITAGMEFVK